MISFIFHFFSVITCASQTYNPFYQNIINQINTDSIKNNLIQFQNLGIKTPGSTELQNTCQWIKNRYNSLNYNIIQEDTFYHSGHNCINLIIEKPGTAPNDVTLIIGAHYDTKNGPGVNDNGSGTAILLEIARIIKTIPTHSRVRFIHFSAEESGLIGSQHYVSNVLNPSGDLIKLMFNIDEVGGNILSNNTRIKCERDESSPTTNNYTSSLYTDTLYRLTGLYTNLEPEYGPAYGSDYLPFQDANYIITGLYESNKSSVYHTIYDSINYLDINYVYQVCRISVAATLYFANAYDSTTSSEQNPELRTTIQYNRTDKNIQIHSKQPIRSVNIFTNTGTCIYSNSHSSDQYLNIPANLAPGIYFITIINSYGIQQISKLIVI